MADAALVMAGMARLPGVTYSVLAPNAKGLEGALAARADEVSRWVLGEALPVALPDGRWDKMVYGIRDCESYLRAIQ
mgnify:CR=1 FL=1